MQKLYIYDPTDFANRSQAKGRFSNSKNVTTRKVTSIKEFLDVFKALIAAKQTFGKVLIQTHAQSGDIVFGEDSITPIVLKTRFYGQNLHKALATGAHLHFDGCKVAEGDKGWLFLATAGTIFLKEGGGTCSGWTNRGTGVPGFLYGIGGHTLHFNLFQKNFRTVVIDYNGSFKSRSES